METRTCKICNIEKSINNFSKRKTEIGTLYFRTECKECRKIYSKKYYKNNNKILKLKALDYSINNKEIIKEKKKEYYQNNKIEINIDNNKRYNDNKNYYNISKKKHYQENKDQINKQKNEYSKNKEKNVPSYKLRRRLSHMIWNGLNNNCSSKNGESSLKYLPYSIQELKDYLESKFAPWMTWENHGNYDIKSWNDNDSSTWTWQLDHIIPQSDLPYSNMEDENFKKCWGLDNLRPLSAKQNIIDGPSRIRHSKKVA